MVFAHNQMIMKQTLEEAFEQSWLNDYYHGNYKGHAQVGFYAGAEWQAKQSPWISIKEAIPNKDAEGVCSVLRCDGSIDRIAMRNVWKWAYPYIKTGYVTHWKPL